MRLALPYEGLEVWFERVGYEPGEEQGEIHRAALEVKESGPTTIIVGGGIQGGKSTVGGNHAFARWMVDPLIWMVGDRHEDCKREYEICRDAAIEAKVTEKGMYSTAAEGPWELRYVNGHRVKTLDSQDPTKLAREAPDGIVFCEPGRQSAEAFNNAWDRVVPRGGWLLVAGTFRG